MRLVGKENGDCGAWITWLKGSHDMKFENIKYLENEVNSPSPPWGKTDSGFKILRDFRNLET